VLEINLSQGMANLASAWQAHAYVNHLWPRMWGRQTFRCPSSLPSSPPSHARSPTAEGSTSSGGTSQTLHAAKHEKTHNSARLDYGCVIS